MYKTCFMIFVVLFHGFATSTCSWASVLARKLREDVELHHAVVLGGNTRTLNDFCIELTKETSTISKTIVDTETINADDSRRRIGAINFAAPTIFIIIVDVDEVPLSSSSIRRTINSIVKIRPLPTRPKCLLILRWNYDNSSFADMFRYSWTLKFVDFSVVNINAGSPTIQHYNPFFGVVSTELLLPTTSIFPDKLSNMHGYPFQLMLVYSKPELTFSAINGRVTRVNGETHRLFRVFSENVRANLIYDFERSNHENRSYSLNFQDTLKMIDHLERGKINSSTFVCTLGTFCYNKSIVAARVHDNRKIVIVVPVIKVRRLRVPTEIARDGAIVVGITLIVLLTIKLFKFPTTRWNLEYIFRNTLGFSIPSEPRRTTERIVFFTVTFVSTVYSVNVVSNLVNVQIINEEVNFDTAQSIVEFPLTIYANKYHIAAMVNHPSDNVRRLADKVELMKNVDFCFDKLIETREVACVASTTRADYHALRHRDERGSPIMKLTDLTIFTDFLAFAFEKASPYVPKFNRILQRLVEAGISKSCIIKQDYLYNVSLRSGVDNGTADETRWPTLLLLLLVGFGLSICVFALELCTRRCKTFDKRKHFERRTSVIFGEG